LIGAQEGSVLQEVSHFPNVAESVIVCWIPEHTGLPGNKGANVATKEGAVLGKLTSVRALGRMSILLFLWHLSLWQDDWTSTVDSELQSLKRTSTVDSELQSLKLCVCHQEERGHYAWF
jgi:hypothetical protein